MKRFAHDYQPNDKVLKLVYKPGKLEPRAIGPYRCGTYQWYSYPTAESSDRRTNLVETDQALSSVKH